MFIKNFKLFYKRILSIPRIVYKKSGLEKAIQKHEMIRKITRIPIVKVRCQEKPFSVIQGFSGKSIEYFPPCQFFSLSLTDTQKALANFKNWLRTSLLDLEGWKIPKVDGGYAGGSLYKYIFQLHEDNGIPLINFECANMELIEEAISYRANYYLRLFNYIKVNHHKKKFHMPICCLPANSDGLFIIIDGHHRVSAMKALGLKEVEAVVLQEGKRR